MHLYNYLFCAVEVILDLSVLDRSQYNITQENHAFLAFDGENIEILTQMCFFCIEMLVCHSCYPLGIHLVQFNFQYLLNYN